VSTIGRHFSGVAFRIVLLMALGGLAQILYNVSTSTVLTWILAAAPVVLGVLILLLPLGSLYRVLHNAKDAVLRELEEEYDDLALGFVTHLTDQRQFRTTGRSENADKDVTVQMTSLRRIIEEIREESTSPVRAPVVVRIIATSLIPLVYFFLQELIRGLWLR
jgi:hypothetical protein